MPIKLRRFGNRRCRRMDKCRQAQSISTVLYSIPSTSLMKGCRLGSLSAVDGAGCQYWPLLSGRLSNRNRQDQPASGAKIGSESHVLALKLHDNQYDVNLSVRQTNLRHPRLAPVLVQKTIKAVILIRKSAHASCPS